MNIEKNNSKAFVLWFTGLSGSGKSTLADRVYDYLFEKGYKVERLDGDVVRFIFPQTGFSKEERDTHIRRIGFFASILEKNNVITICSFVSPYKESREFVKQICNNVIEVYVSASVEECKKRDVKGLYEKAENREIDNFTGVSDPYEIPENPQIIVDTEKESIEESAKKIQNYIEKLLK